MHVWGGWAVAARTCGYGIARWQHEDICVRYDAALHAEDDEGRERRCNDSKAGRSSSRFGGRLSCPLNMTKHLGTRLDSSEGRNDIKLTVLLKMMTWMD